METTINEYLKKFGKIFHGIFKQIFIEEEPTVRKEYLKKLDAIRKGKFIRVKNIRERYG